MVCSLIHDGDPITEHKSVRDIKVDFAYTAPNFDAGMKKSEESFESEKVPGELPNGLTMHDTSGPEYTQNVLSQIYHCDYYSNFSCGTKS